MKTQENNPLLAPFAAPFQMPPFEAIRLEHYEPAFDTAIREAQADVERIASNPEPPTFANTVEALDAAGARLDAISSIFFNLNTACTSSEMQAIAQRVSPRLSEYGNSITLNPQLFARVKQIHDSRASLALSPEQSTLLDDTYRMFVRGGANLEGEARARFREITAELSRLTLRFEENTLAATNAFTLHLTDPADLSGLPDSAREAAAHNARSQGVEGWLFTLHAPDYIPFMRYADNRSLRERMYRAYASRCNQGGTDDNNSIICQIVNLRLEKARLLGYATYADYVLANRMAETPATVNGFLQQLFAASHPHAVADKREVEDFARRSGFSEPLQRWDWAYYSNKLKQEKYALDDELLRPYFPLEKVREGIFSLAHRLYGITFKEVDNLPRYHPDVRTFEVYDRDGSFLAVFLADFFPRESKGGGAWMTDYRVQHREQGQDIRPIISIVTNFTKPTPSRPSLLTFDEVTTFLHEFGHALHGMLSQCTYRATGGTNVLRDFVELPSQIMENWAFEKEWLDTFAAHYETHAPIPADYISRIRRAANFQSGYQFNRQLSFGILDMAWHSLATPFSGSVPEFEAHATAPLELFPLVPGACTSTAFGHIFSGGYAAGYYGYKWAEVLDADAFALFKANGIFDPATADSFRRNILSRGGSEHPMTLYKRFRGAAPSVNALLSRSGLSTPPIPEPIS